MATYIYRCNCVEGEIEVTQPMSEDAFTNCLQVYQRLDQPAPDVCREKGGCNAERLIAGANGVVVKGARSSCSIGDRASSCGSCCATAPGGGGGCPFG